MKVALFDADNSDISAEYLKTNLLAKQHEIVVVVSKLLHESNDFTSVDKRFSYVFLTGNKANDIRLLQQEQIDFVFPLYDISLHICEELFFELIPQYVNNPQSSQFRQNKFWMQECLQKNGVEHTKSYLVSNKNLQLPQIENYPVFVKPCIQAGTKGATKCNNFTDILDYQQLHDYEFVIQEFLTGVDYFIDTFTYDGQNYIASVQHCYREYWDNIPILRYFEVVDPACPEWDRLVNYTDSVLRASHTQFGFGHIEVMLNNGIAKLIEINSRVSGAMGLCNQAAQISLGRHQYGLFQAALDGGLSAVENKPVLQKFTRVVSLYTHETITFKQLNEQINQLASLVNVVVLVDSGNIVKPPKDFGDMIAYVVLSNTSISVLEDDMQLMLQLEKTGELYR